MNLDSKQTEETTMNTVDTRPWHSRPVTPPIRQDLWASCGNCYYIYPYRQKLDEVAMNIYGGVGSPVFTRFDSVEGVCEILTSRNGVLATVRVTGEAGFAESASVHLRNPAHQEHFKDTFGGLPVSFHQLV